MQYQLKSLLFLGPICLTLAMAGAWSTPASAQQALAPASVQDSRTPLIILRFNQPQLNFKQALYDAASSALAARADVMFDIVLHPAAAYQDSNSNLQRVTAAMNEMGMPQNRITVIQGEVSGKGYDEVWIYVR